MLDSYLFELSGRARTPAVVAGTRTPQAGRMAADRKQADRTAAARKPAGRKAEAEAGSPEEEVGVVQPAAEGPAFQLVAVACPVLFEPCCLHHQL